MLQSCLLIPCIARLPFLQPIRLSPTTGHALVFGQGRPQAAAPTKTIGGSRPMPLPADMDASSPKHLRDKYAIVGVGETTYTRGSGMTTRSLGTWAVRNAILDAGLKPTDIDGMLSYQSG